MASPRRHRIRIFGNGLGATTTALAIGIVFALTVVIPSAQAQTYTDLYNFTNGTGGEGPVAGVTLDRGGNLYGTASYGGSGGRGTVYKLTHKSSGSWVFNPLYSFAGSTDGDEPQARVIFGPNGTLYGTTTFGGAVGYGTVFNLRPPAGVCKSVVCPWTETLLYSFTGHADGAYPQYGDVVFDQAGNLYGTTATEGSHGAGVVYELTPSGGGWTESVLYNFAGGSKDGGVPYSGVIFDKAGNLYGTTTVGGIGHNLGTVYELTPEGSGWTEKVLYSFQGGSDGAYPYGGLIFDESGNLYGTTSLGGLDGGGTVYELMPSGGGWTETVLWNFSGDAGPYSSLAMDAAGNLYGTTYEDNGVNYKGFVFKLTPSGGGWTYTDLHDFCSEGGSGCTDGENPIGGVALDASGNLYGTAYGAGKYGGGVVWEITP